MAKKIILVLMMALLLTGCSSKESNDAKKAETIAKNASKKIKITEENYIQWISEMNMNPDSYIGATVQLEGLFTSAGHSSIGNTYNYVYRRGLGCCSTDGGIFGLEFMYDGDLPENDKWVDVTGILSEFNNDGVTKLVIEAENVTVKDEYGTVFLGQ